MGLVKSRILVPRRNSVFVPFFTSMVHGLLVFTKTGKRTYGQANVGTVDEFMTDRDFGTDRTGIALFILVTNFVALKAASCSFDSQFFLNTRSSRANACGCQ